MSGTENTFTLVVSESIDLPINVYVGIGLEILVIIIIIVFLTKFKNNPFTLFFDSIYEKLYSFFEEILEGINEYWIKSYVVSLFFVILFSNLLGVILDIVYPIFGKDVYGEYLLEHYIKIPTADISYNLGIALISVFLVLFIQMKYIGIFKFIHEYVPIFGKGVINTIERGNMPGYIYYPLWLIIKIFDIVLSLFLGFLDIIGTIAKVISLSFRLFGNMTSGSMLLVMLMAGMSGLTASLFSIKFPIILPVLLYLQGILVALIQAFVFALLVAIFIKVGAIQE